MDLFRVSEREQKYLYGIRAIACATVILHHCCIYFGFKYAFGQLGRGAVGIFLVLSGYLLGGQLKAELDKTGAINFPVFYAKRFLRIVPVAYAGAVFGYFLNSYLHLYQETKYWTVFGFLLNQIDLPVAPNLIHYWSLCVEMHAYLALPLLLFSITKIENKSRLLYATCVAGVAVALFVVNLNPDFQTYTTPSWLWAVLLGAAGAYRLLELRRIFVLLFLSLILGFVAKLFQFQIDSARYFCALLGLLMIRLGKAGKLPVLSSRPLVVLGKLSFSLYVYQQFVFSSEIPRTYFPLAVLACCLLTYLSYRFIELPCSSLKTKFAKHPGLDP